MRTNMSRMLLDSSDEAQDSMGVSASAGSLPFDGFLWGAGIECSFLPHLNVDQFCWTQHDRQWKDDFRRAREELGIVHLRYAFPWHKLEPRRGAFDWQMADERIEEAQRIGLKLILDVIHFGTPLWLKQAVGDPEFPDALEDYAAILTQRYADRVSCWCPLNEPLVTSLFSGDLGFWPPHQRRWRGYMPVLSRVIQGTSRAIRAIRAHAPDAKIMLCDSAENFKTRDPHLELEVGRRNLRRFISLDLLTGRVDRHHPLFAWLTNYGMSELDIEWFRTNPQTPDVLGLDYYPHSDWQIEMDGQAIQQRRAESPLGLFGVAQAYYNRYGIPIALTETSADGKPIDREIWLDTTLKDIRRLREAGIPMLGLIWWPLIDQLDWDGALTHRIGKIHRVGLYTLNRQSGGTLKRVATSLVKCFRQAMQNEEASIGKLDHIAYPSAGDDEQLPPLGEWETPTQFEVKPLREGISDGKGNGNGNGNGHGSGRKTASHHQSRQAAPGIAAEPAIEPTTRAGEDDEAATGTGAYGIVVFSHLRWGFVWQRPQQFLSRFAREHRILFIEEPFFDLPEGAEPQVSLHRVMPNVAVAAPHVPQSWNRNSDLPATLRRLAKQAVEQVNDDGTFDRPLLWYYSPMDASWSLGHFENRGIIYDSMDELSQFSGAPAALQESEARLMEYSDVVFAGGYELSVRKKQRHDNVHFFGCGVEYEHFAQAQDEETAIPPDIDFMCRPIIGWFGVIDERVDYALVAEIARARPSWSFAMVGPVVKMDPNFLPHAPNLFWLGQRDYSALPNYCRAFSVCMMPFAINAATEYINPTKVLEYLATGRPVVSTPVKDVIRQYTDLVEIASGPEPFIQACERALRHQDKDRIQRGIERARQSSWDSTVKKMQQLVREAIEGSDRRSARKIPPIREAELSYVYTATQGS